MFTFKRYCPLKGFAKQPRRPYGTVPLHRSELEKGRAHTSSTVNVYRVKIIALPLKHLVKPVSVLLVAALLSHQEGACFTS